MTSALEGGEWSAARPGRTSHFTPEKDPVGGWVGPRARLDGWEISSPPGLDRNMWLNNLCTTLSDNIIVF